MKIHTIKNRWFLPVLSCAALAMTSHSQAAVLVTFEQVGDDVVATWSGSFDAGTWLSDGFVNGAISAGSTSLLGFGASEFEEYTGGVAQIPLFGGIITASVGNAGFISTSFYIAGLDDELAPGSAVFNFDDLNVSQTFGDQTLASIGATSFNNTLAWTSTVGGTNTISYTTVPEPSSTALIGLGALALAVRRRR